MTKKVITALASFLFAVFAGWLVGSASGNGWGTEQCGAFISVALLFWLIALFPIFMEKY